MIPADTAVDGTVITGAYFKFNMKLRFWPAEYTFRVRRRVPLALGTGNF